jgi:hypothetical protein
MNRMLANRPRPTVLMSYILLIAARTGRAALPDSVTPELRMILSEKTAAFRDYAVTYSALMRMPQKSDFSAIGVS